jgi:hypothetical protein
MLSLRMASAVISCSSLVYVLFVSLLSFVLFLSSLFDFNIKLLQMNDSSLLAASVQKVQAAKKGVSLPTSLEDAAMYIIIAHGICCYFSFFSCVCLVCLAPFVCFVSYLFLFQY